MPVLTPYELWQQSGRDAIPEIFRLEDRNGREYVLPMTHEETVTFHAREISSYRQLPQLLYHFSIKERDEPRSRGGLLAAARVHHEGRVLVRPRRGGARRRLPQERAGVPPDVPARGSRVLGRPGRVRDDGRQGVDRLPRALGLGREHARDLRERRLRRRSRGRARRSASGRRSRTRSTRRRRSRRLASRRSKRSREMLGIDAAATSKAMPVVRTRRTARARSRPRGRPAVGAEDARGARERLPPGDGRGDQGSVRRERRIARPGRGRCRGHRRRGSAGRPVRRRREPRRLAPARRRGRTRLRAALRRHPRGARGRHVPELRRRAPLPDRDRGRAHLQVRLALLGRRSMRPSSTRTVSRGRSSAGATASALRASWRRRSSSRTTRTGSSGRPRSRRTTSTCSPCTVGPRRCSPRPRERRGDAFRGGLRRAPRRPRRAAG